MADEKIVKFLQGDDKRYIRALRLLELIEISNKLLENNKEDASAVRAYTGMKNKHVQELISLLSEYNVDLQIAA